MRKLFALLGISLLLFSLPAFAQTDSDNDGVEDSVDLCVGEDASFLDVDGDGCIDAAASTRLMEYWDAADLPLAFVIHENGAPGIDDGSDIPAVQAGYDAWPAITGVTLSASYDGTTAEADADGMDGIHSVTFEDSQFLAIYGSSVLAVGVTTSFTTATNFLGRDVRPGQIVDADMIFNPIRQFSTDSDGFGPDLRSVATHEAGHLYGFRHSSVITSTMFPALPVGTNARTLELEDQIMAFAGYPEAAALATATSVSGTVQDGASLDPIGGAAVFAISVATGDTLGATYTFEDGTWQFAGLPDGEYYVGISPLDGTNTNGVVPGLISEYVEGITTNTLWDPEFWDLGESNSDNGSDQDPVSLSGGTPVTGIDIQTNVDVVPPQLVGVTPDGAATVRADAVFFVEFDEDIDFDSAKTSITLTQTAGPSPGAKGFALLQVTTDNVVIVDPAGLMDHSASYELVIGAGLTDRFGNPLGADATTAFTVEAAPPLTISTVSPTLMSGGTVAVIYGQGFDLTSAANNTVTFGSTVVPASTVGANTISVTVPADLPEGPVSLTVDTPTETSNLLTVTGVISNDFVKGTDILDIALGADPEAVVLLPDAIFGYVATSGGIVSVSSGFANPDFGSTTSIAFADGTVDLAVAPDGNRVYAVSREGRKLLVINSDYGDVAAPNATFNTILDELAIDGEPVGIAVDPAGERAYIATVSGQVQIWDIELGSATYHRQVGLLVSSLPSLQGAITVDRTGVRVLALAGTGELLIWDASDPTAAPIEAPITSDPRDITIDPQGTVAYVTDGVGTISVALLTSGTVTQTILASGEPYALALTPSGKRGYAADRANDELAAVDFDPASPSFRTVTTALPVGVQPVDVVASPDADYLLVVEQGSQKLRIVGIAQGPEITNIEPRWVLPGDIVHISGTGFAFLHPSTGNPNSNNVYFNGVPVTPGYSTDTSIFIAVPSDFTGGTVRVGKTGAVGPGMPGEYLSNPVSLLLLDQATGPGDTDVFLHTSNGYDWDDVGVVASVATSPTGKFMIAISLADAAYLIDTDRNSSQFGEIIDRTSLNADCKPGRMVIAPDGKLAYYAGTDEEIHILDVDPESPTYLTGLGRIFWTLFGTPGYPDHLEITKDGRFLVATDELNDQIYLCDLDPNSASYHETLSSTGPLGYAKGMAVHPSGLAVYITATTGYMHVVNLDPLAFGGDLYMGEVTTREWGGLRDVVFSNDGSRAYVLRRGGGPTGEFQMIEYDTSDPYSPQQLGQAQTMLATASGTEGVMSISPDGNRVIVDIPVDGLTLDLDVSDAVPAGSVFVETDQLNINGTMDLVDLEWMPDGSGFWSASRGDTGIRYVDLIDVQKAEPVSGHGQVGVAGEPLPAPIVWRSLGAGPRAGAVAEVEITGGGGTLGNGTQYQWLAADENGDIAIDWTLGPAPDSGAPANELMVTWNDGFSVADGITAVSVADPNTLPLSQVQVLPSHEATGISLTSTVQVSFSRGIDPATIDPSSLILRKQSDGTLVNVAYGFAGGNASVSMVPLAGLEPSTVFEIETTSAITDATGGPLTNPTVSSFTTQAPPPLSISAISPPAATVGTQIVISGSGLAATPADNTVHFGAASATAVSGGPGFITVYVPLGAETGDLTVEANAQTSNGLTFAVLVPETAPLDEVFSTVETGISVQSVAVTPDGAKAYTVSTETGEVLPVDLATFTNLPAITVGTAPQGVVIHPDGGAAYVTNYGSGSVSVIDTAADAVIATINVGTNPVELVASPIGDRLYVVNELDQTLSVIDIDATSATYHTVVASTPTFRSSRGAAIRPDGTVLYLGVSDGFISIDLTPTTSYGVVTAYNTGRSTKGAAITPDGSLLLLVTTANEVLVVDVSVGGSNTVVATVPTTKSTKGAAITPDGSLLYLLQEDTNEVFVVELNITAPVGTYLGVGPVIVTPVFVKSIPVAESPSVLAFDPSGSGLAIIAHERANGQLSFLNTSSIPRGEYEATVELAPNELNDLTRGFYMNVYLIMPDEVDAAGVDLTSIRMNGVLAAVVDQCELIDRDGDTDMDVLLRFERREVVALLERGDNVEVFISGISEPGHRSFTGSDNMSTRWPIITRPYGNQLLLGGTPFEITWNDPGGFQADCIHVHHSAVNGQWWRWVSYDAADTGSFMWLVPPIFSHNSIIEIVFYKNVQGTHEHAAVPIDPTQPEPDEKEIVAIALSPNFRVKDPAVPVVMQDVDLGVREGSGLIEWSIADAYAVEGFHVLRADTEDGQYEIVNDALVTAVSTPDGMKFAFEDQSIFANRDYYYVLQEDRGPEKGFDHGPYRLNWKLQNALFQNNPNSFNPRTTISFSTAQDGRARLAVYNVAGRLVDVIVDEFLRADAHEYTWEGKDRQGRSVASGVYIYRLSAPGGFIAARKMTLVR